MGMEAKKLQAKIRQLATSWQFAVGQLAEENYLGQLVDALAQVPSGIVAYDPLDHRWLTLEQANEAQDGGDLITFLPAVKVQ